MTNLIEDLSTLGLDDIERIERLTMRWLFQALSFTSNGDVVLDCFVGSGTTAVAAILEGRHYIGIDKEPHYVEMATKACRMARNSLQLALRL